MLPKSYKAVSWFLILLLVLAPLQGALAYVSSAGESSMASAMMVMDTGELLDDMNMDCQHCDQYECGGEDSCDLHNCFLFIPAPLSGRHPPLLGQMAAALPPQNMPADLYRSLFRPPRV